MLFTEKVLRGIAAGQVTLAFRRWRRRPPAPGSQLRSPVGVIALERVTVIEDGDITAADIQRTGLSRDELRAAIAGDGTLLRIELRLIGADPRIALRAETPGSADLDAIHARLAKADAAAGEPWTTRYLALIARQPATVSHELARQAGVETPLFKRRVRRLKELGLTESLEVGYRLSPRGRAVFESRAKRDNRDNADEAPGSD